MLALGRWFQRAPSPPLQSRRNTIDLSKANLKSKNGTEGEWDSLLHRDQGALVAKSPELIRVLQILTSKKEIWIGDNETQQCFLCSCKFTTLRRRHHCRVCGEVFCKNCSNRKISLPTKQQRCCEQCYTFLAVTPEGECAYVLGVRLAETRPKFRECVQTESSDSDEAEDVFDKKPTNIKKPPKATVTPLSTSLTNRASGISRARRNTKNPQPLQNDHALNAQLFVNVIEATFPPLSIEDCSGFYCVVILGNQKEITSVSNKTTSSGFWKEGFFFDVTRPESELRISLYAKCDSEHVLIGRAVVAISSLEVGKPGELTIPLFKKSNGPSNGDLRIRIDYNTTTEKVIFDDFILMKVVGRGSFGKVIQVRKKDTGRIYAMKIIRKSVVINNDAIQHTLSERNVLRKIQHPFIVSLKYSFQTDNKLYLVLDYLCGGELFTHLSSVDHFDENRARFYAAQIVLAIGYLHEHKVLYRDLKPENILLDIDGYIGITDFGLCKEGVGCSDRTTTVCGSPEYLAPEMLRHEAYGKEVDWWALGTFLYEMLSGWPPYYDEDTREMNRKILKEPLGFDPYLFSNDAISLLTGLLDRDPSKRLGTGVDGTEHIKAHPFFKSINWSKLYHRELAAPFRPEVGCYTSTEQFDPQFTDEPVKDTPVDDSLLSRTLQDQFKGFSWVAPSNLDTTPEGRVKRNGSNKLIASFLPPEDSSREGSWDMDQAAKDNESLDNFIFH
eukprot:TRINITY_DN7650_c0_g1_i1.p1 TRINITY_DN7650_c0_g1~~TRINITY_DN7650_c0_g1_i1.p1  ORF type:complete len:727 (-),score=135.20 TRINITY_DN7650_c0_g1_i1:126-2306(-)